MNARMRTDAMRYLGLAVQVVPLAAVAVLLFLVSKETDTADGLPGVAGAQGEPPWLFPYSIALGLVSLAAIVSRKAAAAAAVLALVAIVYFLRFINQKPPEMLGISLAAFFAALAGVSIIGWLIQIVTARRAER